MYGTATEGKSNNTSLPSIKSLENVCLAMSVLLIDGCDCCMHSAAGVMESDKWGGMELLDEEEEQRGDLSDQC